MLGSILTLLSVLENTLSTKCSLKYNWTAEVQQKLGRGLQQETGSGGAARNWIVGGAEGNWVAGVQQENGSWGRFGFLLCIMVWCTIRVWCTACSYCSVLLLSFFFCEK